MLIDKDQALHFYGETLFKYTSALLVGLDKEEIDSG